MPARTESPEAHISLPLASESHRTADDRLESVAHRVPDASRHREEIWRHIVENASDIVYTHDLGGRFTFVNRAGEHVLGYTRDEILGMRVIDLVAPESRPVLKEMQRRYAQVDPLLYEVIVIARSGARLTMEVSTRPILEEGIPVGIQGIARDVTDRRRTEEALRETNQRLSVWVQELEQRTREIGLLSQMGDLLRACRSPEEACMVVVPIAAKLFPESSGVISLVGDGVPTALDPVAYWGESRPLEPFLLDECWALRRGRSHVLEAREEGPVCRHLEAVPGAAGMCVPMMAHGELLGVLSMMVAEHRALTDPRQTLALTVAEHASLALANLRLQDTLRSQAIRDPLTNLFNRRYMEESLEREMRRAIRSRASVGIIMLDLDHFKQFNDTQGHDAGDALLRAVGAVLQRSIRAEDIACRYGGEEFTLILPEASLPEAALRADYLRVAVRQLLVPHRRHTLPPVTMSAGVAVYPEHGPTGDAVLRAADAALYEAKARGRDRVVLNETGGLFAEGLVEFGRRSPPARTEE